MGTDLEESGEVFHDIDVRDRFHHGALTSAEVPVGLVNRVRVMGEILNRQQGMHLEITGTRTRQRCEDLKTNSSLVCGANPTPRPPPVLPQ